MTFVRGTYWVNVVGCWLCARSEAFACLVRLLQFTLRLPHPSWFSREGSSGECPWTWHIGKACPLFFLVNSKPLFKILFSEFLRPELLVNHSLHGHLLFCKWSSHGDLSFLSLLFLSMHLLPRLASNSWLLPQTLECWDYRYVCSTVPSSLTMVYFLLLVEPWVLQGFLILQKSGKWHLYVWLPGNGLDKP